MCITTHTLRDSQLIDNAELRRSICRLPKPFRKVRFAPVEVASTHTILSLEDYTPQEKCDCWFKAQDFTSFKLQARQVIRILQEQGTRLIDDSLMLAQDLRARGEQRKGELDVVMSNPQIYTVKLEKVRAGRGLEKYASAFHRAEREQESNYARKAVLEMDILGASDDEIAEAYARNSMSSKIYSRLVGHADFATQLTYAVRSKQTAVV